MSKRHLSTLMNNRYWKDEAHEDAGGNDNIGPRQQDGRRLMKEETEKLLRTISGITGHIAWDDVTGGELKLAGVKEARREELRCFQKRNAYT